MGTTGTWTVHGSLVMCVCLLQSEERSGARDRGPSRRSKSEGPPGECDYRTRYLSPRARLRNMRYDSDPNNFDQELVVILTPFSSPKM